MKILRHLILASLLAAPAAVMAAPRPGPEQQLAEIVSGRIAGRPVPCINLQNVRSTRIVDRTAIVYEAFGGTLYVNRPDSGSEMLHRDSTLVNRTGSSQLCSVDIVRLFEPGMPRPVASVGLGSFVPYTVAPPPHRIALPPIFRPGRGAPLPPPPPPPPHRRYP